MWSYLLQSSSFHRETNDSVQKSYLYLVSEGFPFISLACYLFPRPPGGAVLSVKGEKKIFNIFQITSIKLEAEWEAFPQMSLGIHKRPDIKNDGII